MKRNVLMALLLAVGVMFTACEKKAGNCASSLSLGKRIQGSWQLEEVFNPWTNETHPPTDTERETLEFKGDSLIVVDYQNQKTTTAYSLNDTWLTSGVVNGHVTLDSATCNTLTIDNTPVDGPRKTYSRVLDE